MEQLKKEIPPQSAIPPKEIPPPQAEVTAEEQPKKATPTAETIQATEIERARIKQSLRRFGAGAAALGGVVTMPTKAGAAVIGTAEAAAAVSHTGGFWAGVGKTLGGLEVLFGFGFIVRWINNQIQKQVTGSSSGGGGASKPKASGGGGDHH